jgi:hypothetical protein
MSEKRYYTAEVEASKYYVYCMLNEKQRRHFVAVDAMQLGVESHSYLEELYGINVKTIKAGLEDLEKKNDR